MLEKDNRIFFEVLLERLDECSRLDYVLVSINPRSGGISLDEYRGLLAIQLLGFDPILIDIEFEVKGLFVHR